MDRLEAIKILLRVFETKSFSVPARELGVGQPAVSKTIARLEAELGVRLVGRTTRSVSPTPAGLRLAAELGPMALALDEGIARLARGDRAPAGTVRIAVAPGFGRACLVPIVRVLRATQPAISVELAVGDRLADLVAENIDLAIRAGPLNDSSHVARRIGETPVVTIGSVQYLARHGEPQSPEELHAHDCVMAFTRGARRAWRFGSPVPTPYHPARAPFLSSSADDIRAAVLAGIGLAQVPGWLMARDMAAGTVKAIMRSHEPPSLTVFLVRSSERRPPDRVRAVADVLVRELPRMLEG